MSAVETPLATAPAPAATPSAAARVLGRRWLVLVPLLLSLGFMVLAMRRTSATFDEIVLIAGGARGFQTGDFGLAPDHPPVMQYVYGLPAYLSHANYPSESPEGRWNSRTRYGYARAFFWGAHNDPEQLAFRSRLVAVLLAGLLILVVWGFTLRAYGPRPALLAATLVAFLPDVLAHGGVAYNDVPTALLYLATLWAVDAAARRPTIARGALAGLLAALAIGVKYSAILIAPAALLLVAAEALARRSGGRAGGGEPDGAVAAHWRERWSWRLG
ncbi:MAG TPA: glycosyltransferase family 39 protein, partial [Longimicrobiales bacterium]